LNKRNTPKKRLILNSSGKLLSKVIPWNVGLAIAEPIARLVGPPPQRLVEPFVKRGQVVADLGCGRGYYSLALAKLVGAGGKVYAIDLNKTNIRVLRKRADKAGYNKIEVHESSAADLSFIKDKSIDFILANGLL
jgi:2-polyprenyl-3-methyl-5-hydroxy-6-metoxy-1,4-benzoquinol methylase